MMATGFRLSDALVNCADSSHVAFGYGFTAEKCTTACAPRSVSRQAPTASASATSARTKRAPSGTRASTKYFGCSISTTSYPPSEQRCVASLVPRLPLPPVMTTFFRRSSRDASRAA